ncbi:hypothetical protein Tco_1126370, partial [Tanacetum coccineum]
KLLMVIESWNEQAGSLAKLAADDKCNMEVTAFGIKLNGNDDDPLHTLQSTLSFKDIVRFCIALWSWVAESLAFISSSAAIQRGQTKTVINGLNLTPDESKNDAIEVTCVTENDPGLEPKKIKIQSDASGNRPSSNAHNTCRVCSMEKLAFSPAPIYRSSCEILIKRNIGYYRSPNEMDHRTCGLYNEEKDVDVKT